MTAAIDEDTVTGPAATLPLPVVDELPVSEEDVRPRGLLRLVLHLFTAGLLGWVSYGSHEVLVWIGMPGGWAWVYPAVVDLALLYATPFAVDAALPDSIEWPLRSKAKTIRKRVLPVIAAFNIIHMLLFVLDHPPHFTNPVVTAIGTVVAFAVAAIAGFVPVWLYANVVSIQIMFTAWTRWAKAEIKRTVERRAQEKAERERNAEKAAEAEAAKIHAETEAQLRLIEAETKLQEAKAAAKATRESRRDSRGPSRREPSRDSRPVHVMPAREDTTPADRDITPVSSGDPWLDELVSRVEGDSDSARCRWVFVNAWKAGREPGPAQVAQLLDCTPATARQAKKSVMDAAKAGDPNVVLPPSERRPSLSLAANS